MLRKGTKRIQLTGGEPLLYPQIETILNRYNDCLFSITTSGYIKDNVLERILSYKNVDILQVSLYSHIKKKHNRIANVSKAYQETVNTIKKIVSSKKFLIVSTLLLPDNLNEMEEFVQFCIDLGANAVKFGKVILAGRAEYANLPLILSKKEYESSKAQINNLADKYASQIYIFRDECEEAYSKKASFFQCTAGSLSWTISETGVIFPCSFYMNEILKIGDISEQQTYLDLLFFKTCFENYQHSWYKKRQLIKKLLAVDGENHVCKNITIS